MTPNYLIRSMRLTWVSGIPILSLSLSTLLLSITPIFNLNFFINNSCILSIFFPPNPKCPLELLDCVNKLVVNSSMAASVSCHYFSSPLTTSTKSIKPKLNYSHFAPALSKGSIRHFVPLCSSQRSLPSESECQDKEASSIILLHFFFFFIKKIDVH